MKELTSLSKEKFGMTIMAMAKEFEIDSVEAILHYCESNGVNMDDVIPMLDKGMQEQVRVDSIRARRVLGFKLSELDL